VQWRHFFLAARDAPAVGITGACTMVPFHTGTYPVNQWFILMFPASDGESSVGNLVNGSFAGVNVDALVATGEWVQVPPFLGHLCEIQNKFSEREDHCTASAMDWATRRIMGTAAQPSSGDDPSSVGTLRREYAGHLLDYMVNSWNKGWVIKTVPCIA